MLGLSQARFWNKYKNMRILRIRREKYDISTMRVAHSPGDISSYFYRLNWQEEQLTGVEKVDSLKDLRLEMEAKRKVGKKKKKKEVVNK